MKRLSLLLLFVCAALFSFAQNLEDVNKLTVAKKFPEAKTAIDAYLADPKNVNKADGAWYLKGRIYNILSFENAYTPEQKFALKRDAYDAFKKEQQLDPKDINMKLEAYISYLDLYLGFFDLGANMFNAKQYDQAFTSFTKALEVKDFILGKNYTYTQTKLYPLDTALVMNAAISASQAKKDSIAVIYYRKLTDANVSGSGYEDVYRFLADYYSRRDDQASLTPLLAKAKMFYPADNFWSSIEIAGLQKTGDQAAVFAKYDDMLAKDPHNFGLAYDYSVEMYRKIYMGDNKLSDDAAQKAKLTSVLKIAIAADTGNDARMLMSNHLFNAASDLSIAASMIKGVKPEDVKKKKDMTAASIQLMDEFIPYGEAAIKYFEAQPSLKPVQKVNYKMVLGYMNDVYLAKKDPKKAAEYDKKRQALN
jgi:tetratricopeptide (TPR) repeat protein